MALFGGERDISLFRTLNRELINEIIDTEVDIFKAAIHDMSGNIYGEALNKVYKPGVRISCLVEHEDDEWSNDEFGVDKNKIAKFKFLRDDLLPGAGNPNPDAFAIGYADANFGDKSQFPVGNPAANILLEVGDIIYWDNSYWEANAIVEDQYLFGKNPDTDKGYQDGGRESFGSSFSSIVTTHETRKSKLKLEQIRSGAPNRVSNL